MLDGFFYATIERLTNQPQNQDQQPTKPPQWVFVGYAVSITFESFLIMFSCGVLIRAVRKIKRLLKELDSDANTLQLVLHAVSFGIFVVALLVSESL
jgi:hypothetical protein